MLRRDVASLPGRPTREQSWVMQDHRVPKEVQLLCLTLQETPKAPPSKQAAFPPSHFSLLVAPAIRENVSTRIKGRRWSIRGTLATIEKTFWPISVVINLIVFVARKCTDGGWEVGLHGSLFSGALPLQEVVILVNKRVNFKHILTKSNCSGKYHITDVQAGSQLVTLVRI